MSRDMQHTSWPSGDWHHVARGLLIGSMLLVGGCTDLVTGCARLSTNLAFEEVNVVNGGEGTVAGRLAVTDPSGQSVLRETFRLSGTEGDSAYVAYDDVLGEAGRYVVSATILSPEGTPEDSVRKTVRITAPEEEHVMLKVERGSNQPIEVESIGAFNKE